MISVIVPAHNESEVIERTLRTMMEGSNPQELEVILVCNGCKDHTAEIGRRIGPPVRVLETPVANKATALNIGDREARFFPRIYADADVMLSIETLRALARRLERGDVHAVAPFGYNDVSDCSWTVKSYYRIASYLPFSREGIGTSGVYALSEAGRKRFREFPDVMSDDGFVRIQFKPSERDTVQSVQSRVFAPRTMDRLIAIKTRSHLGSFELAENYPDLWANKGESHARALAALLGNPMLWPALLVYGYVTIKARSEAKKRLRRRQFRWERDDSSRAQDGAGSRSVRAP